MCFSERIVNALAGGKYTRWAEQLSAHATLGLIQAVTTYCEVRARLLAQGGFDTLSEFVDLGEANPRLQFGLGLTTSIWSGVDSALAESFDHEVPVPSNLSTVPGTGLSDSCKAVVTGKEAWAAQLSERRLWILLWGVGEFCVRASSSNLKLAFKVASGDRARLYESLVAIQLAYGNDNPQLEYEMTMPEAHEWLQAQWLKLVHESGLTKYASVGTLTLCNGAVREPYLSQKPEHWAKWNSWFPYGRGTFDSYIPFPKGGIMVLGQDWNTEQQFNDQRANNPNFSDTSSRELRRMLNNAGVAEDSVFLTNTFMGLRTGAEATGPFPGGNSPEFLAVCRAFLRKQIELQRPRAILALGGEVIRFLSETLGSARWVNFQNFQALDQAGAAQEIYQEEGDPGWIRLAALLHPAHRVPNLAKGVRKYLGEGPDPEVGLVKWADTGV